MSSAASGMRLEVQVNGEAAATVGLEGEGVLSAIVTWVRRSEPISLPDQANPEATGDIRHDTREQVTIEIAGLDGENRKHLTWLEKPLALGDEVTVRVLPAGETDPPATAFPMSAPPG